MKFAPFQTLVFSLFLIWLLAGCGSGHGVDVKAEAPPPTIVEHEDDVNVVQVDDPARIPLVTAVEHDSRSHVSATGIIGPDVSRSVPVISLAAGRAIEIDARLGDTVQKGQLLLRVQSADVSGAFSSYQKSVADEQLARTQLERANLLYGKGAISLNEMQVAQDAENKAKVDLEDAAERIRVLGGNVDHPAAIVDIRAPVSGVITDQQVATAGGVSGLGSLNLFTISDLSYVWVLCDVYENDLANVHVGENAEVRLNAYPDKVFVGRISNIGSVLDPNLHTAKVRIEIRNTGLMRVGMFVTATFHGQQQETHSAIPASAVLHLHDHDWVYMPVGNNKFRRVEVMSGEILPGGMQEVLSGVKAGQQVVASALVLQSTTEN